jgi:hypothetical protein
MGSGARHSRRLAAWGAAVLAGLACCALAAAMPAGAEGGGASLPESSVLWNGALNLSVACGLSSGTCSGFVSVRAPGAAESEVLVGGDYSVPAGATRTLRFDPGGSETKQLERLDSVVVKLSPRPDGGEGAEATLRVVHKPAPGEGGSPGGGSPGGGNPPKKSHRHERQFTFLAGVEGGKDYWNGTLFEKNNRVAGCLKGQLVLIQRRNGSHWHTVARTRTRSKLNRRHEATFLRVLPEDHGVFRAVAPKSRFRKEICGRAVSKAVSGATGFSP